MKSLFEWVLENDLPEVKNLIQVGPNRGDEPEMLLGAQRLNDQRPIINYRPVSKSGPAQMMKRRIFVLYLTLAQAALILPHLGMRWTNSVRQVHGKDN